MNKNAGLKEKPAPKTTVPPEEADMYPWLEDQVLESPGKLSSDSDQTHLAASQVPKGSSFQSPVLSIILFCNDRRIMKYWVSQKTRSIFPLDVTEKPEQTFRGLVGQPKPFSSCLLKFYSKLSFSFSFFSPRKNP